MGGEKISETTGVDSKEACEQLCKDEEDCKYWLYAFAGFWHKKCALKKGLTSEFSNNQEWTSGECI